MINLESFDQYGTVGRFDPITGVIDKTARAGCMTRNFCGHFGELGERELVFCRLEEGLYVFEGTVFWIASAQTVSWLSDGGRRVLKVSSSKTGSPLVVEYESPDVALEDDYVTSFSSPEDWDFGRFIAAVVGDPERAQRIYR